MLCLAAHGTSKHLHVRSNEAAAAMKQQHKIERHAMQSISQFATFMARRNAASALWQYIRVSLQLSHAMMLRHCRTVCVGWLPLADWRQRLADHLWQLTVPAGAGTWVIAKSTAERQHLCCMGHRQQQQQQHAALPTYAAMAAWRGKDLV
jgi:hypothetical protein